MSQIALVVYLFWEGGRGVGGCNVYPHHLAVWCVILSLICEDYCTFKSCFEMSTNKSNIYIKKEKDKPGYIVITDDTGFLSLTMFTLLTNCFPFFPSFLFWDHLVSPQRTGSPLSLSKGILGNFWSLCIRKLYSKSNRHVFILMYISVCVCLCTCVFITDWLTSCYVTALFIAHSNCSDF